MPNHPFSTHEVRFFVLRTPLLPMDEFLRWTRAAEAIPLDGGDADDRRGRLEQKRRLLRGALAQALASPALLEALAAASPSLVSSLDVWREAPTSPRGRKVERALVSYFIRASTRQIPFGLLAGWSIGRPGSASRLELGPRDEYRRRSRPSSRALFSLARHMAARPELRDQVRYHVNSSTLQVGDRLKLVVRDDANGNYPKYAAIAVERTPELDRLLAAAGAGATRADLARALMDADPDLEEDEVQALVADVIDAQVLVDDLTPSITGPDPTERLLERLAPVGADPAVRALADAVRALAAQDARPLGAAPAGYAVAQALLVRQADRAAGNEEDGEKQGEGDGEGDALPPPAAGPTLLQIDLFKPARRLHLSSEVLDVVKDAVALCHRLSPRSDPLREPRRRFTDRYGARAVPLLEALDAETGIGLEGEADPPSPLVAGLGLVPRPSRAQGPAAFSPLREVHLHRRLHRLLAAGGRELRLDEEDLRALAAPEAPSVPTALSAFVSLLAPSPEALAAGNYQVLFRGAAASSPAAFVGRILHGDPALVGLLRGALDDEASAHADEIAAELVHQPGERICDVALRPVLTEWEIPCLGRSGAPADRQLPLTDLLLAVRHGRFVVISRSLGRRVRITLSTGHNFSMGQNLALYRFLAELGTRQDTHSFAWDWAGFNDWPFLPRVTRGRVVLAPARWKIWKDDLGASAEGADRDPFFAVQRLRDALGLPRFVALQEVDRLLTIDLDNPLCVDVLLGAFKRSEVLRLVEDLQVVDGGCAASPEGVFCHELVIPFVARPARIVKPPLDAGVPPEIPRATRTHAPGSEWTYVKLFAAPETADALLLDVVAPVVEQALGAGIVRRWFFIRFGEGGWHLRVRFRGASPRALAELVPLLHDRCTSWLLSGRLRNFQLDTYDREIERYGGVEAIELAEELFQADSDACLRVLKALGGSDGGATRWTATLLGADALLEDLGFSAAERLQIVERWAAESAREHNVTPATEQRLAARFRSHRPRLERLLQGDVALDDGPEMRVVIDALTTRSTKVRSIARQLRKLEEEGRLTSSVRELAASFVHMHVNRMARTGGRTQETVLYAFLRRLLGSRIAKQARREERGAPRARAGQR